LIFRPEKSNPNVEICTSLFGPKSCPNLEVSNGTNGALLDALTVIRSIFGSSRFFGPEMLTLVVTLVGHFSVRVDPFGSGSTVYGRHLMGHPSRPTTIPIGLTHAEISVIWSIIQAWISRCVFIFFDRSFFLFWETNGGVAGSQTAFGKNSHMLRGMVRKWVEKQPPVGPFFSGCVKYFPKWSFPPMHPWWSPKKGKNFGQKKSTHTDIFNTSINQEPMEILRCVDFF
jgi:hypothetical protein